MRFAILLRISSRRARIAIVLASSLASLGALEAGLRDHDDEIVFLKAGRRYGIRGGSHGTNALGFHERELAMVPDEGTRRIVVLGDSMTWGTTSPHAAWPRIAETTLGTPWQLVNLSMYGYDAEQSLATLESVGWRYHPERVIFASYMNDLVPTELITVETPHFRPGSPLAAFSRGPSAKTSLPPESWKAPSADSATPKVIQVTHSGMR